MAAFINTNIASLNAQNNLNKSQGALTTSLQRLSSGLRINSAKDDSAGLAISERMTSQIKGNDQAARNANDAISMTQTAEGDLSTISDSLQRMRELAVQSSTGSNSASDRLSIDNEVQALSKEIDRVAQNSSFNGNKLLDGSFTSQNIQIGANATSNDTIAIAIGSARTSSLGGVGVTNAASVAGGKTTTALTSGDLTLNGFQVGASGLGAAPGQSTASAFSIANAINAISADSGVTATANSNTVTSANAITDFTAIAAGTFSINGVDVGDVAAGTNSAGQGANVAAAINKIATQTGVTAEADAKTGALTLKAADGRDVSIGMNNTAANATAAGNNQTKLMAQTGLASTVIGTQAVTATGSPAVAAVNTLTFTAGAVANDSITVNGVTFTFAQSGTSSVTVNSATNVTINRDFATTPLTATTSANSLQTAITAAKADSLTTGALATVSSTNGSAGVITLTDNTAGPSTTTTSESSTNTAWVATTAGSAATQDTVTAAVAAANHGTVTLNSSSTNGITFAGKDATKAGFAASGFKAGTVTSSVKSIASINVLTSANATSALSAIDGALATVNASKASLGVYQNRFASVVSNLQSTSENLAASRSRIQDTDFAKETASLTRGQILQQAGTAMLAQANSLSNGVLALLR